MKTSAPSFDKKNYHITHTVSQNAIIFQAEKATLDAICTRTIHLQFSSNHLSLLTCAWKLMRYNRNNLIFEKINDEYRKLHASRETSLEAVNSKPSLMNSEAIYLITLIQRVIASSEN